MPSNQIQASNPPASNELNNINKPPPPPSKPPPPPPPPPKNTRQPLPPPPPPPRNTSQMVNQSTSIINQSLTSIVPPNGMLIHNGSSMSSLNSIGRCSHAGPPNSHYNVSTHSQRNFVRHGECGSRSSLSSHGSQSHHHHMNHMNNGVNQVNNLNNLANAPCSYQQAPPCSWASTAAQDPPHNHIASDSKSDSGVCSTNPHHQNGRCQSHLQCANCCQHNGHANKCQTQNFPLENRINGQNQQPSTVISRNTIMTNQAIGPESQLTNNCFNNTRNHLASEVMPPHHHHHHHHHHNTMHDMQMSSSSTISSVQPIESNMVSTAAHLRADCGVNSNNLMQQSHQVEIRHGNQHLGCNHQHAAASECGHHQPGCLAHDHQSATNGAHHPVMHHGCGTCPYSKKGAVQFECNTNNNQIAAECNAGHPHYHHHCQSEVVPKCQDVGGNGPLITNTTHVHNLSNSSTTTHASNVPVKQQLQSHHHGPALLRGARSSSSQHYEQYGLSSAASTSSATASLSSYPQSMAYDDMSPLFPSSRSNQPVPPPPPPHLSATKSHPASPSHQMFLNHNNLPMHQSNFNYNQQTQLQSPPPPPPPPLSTMAPQNMSNLLPPLPPKPISPNASSCSTQITTVRTSPSLQNQPITRVTSQAGVQNPLPRSDIPPPLPPLNPGLRSQLLSNQIQTKAQAMISSEGTAAQSQQVNYNINLSYNRGGIITDAERKTEALARQVELELDEQQRSGDPIGTCPKCNTKVMLSQEACKAMNQIYHAQCFRCCECGRTLLGKTFYPVGDRVYCEEDFKYTGHMQSLEKCAACFQPIFNMILPAMGKSYHPKCFKCCICGQCLDGVPFTVDRKDKIYCVEDYHNIYSPKCAACGKTISPIDGTGETVRVVSMDKDYHIDCYCCEDCGLQLTDEEPSRSYPLDGHLFCQQCHINRLSRKLPTALSLS